MDILTSQFGIGLCCPPEFGEMQENNGIVEILE